MCEKKFGWKSISVDVNIICYEYETEDVKEIISFLDRTDLLEPVNKIDSLLLVAPRLTLSIRKIGLDVSRQVKRSIDNFLL